MEICLIKNLLKNWNKFGEIDPFWTILTRPDKKGNKWKKDEFFETGIKEIENIMKDIRSLNIQIQNKKALDFGCGVGRLTQAIAIYFEKVCGIDIAPSMIKLAKEYNRNDKCNFYLNVTDDLKIFPKNNFDFIYSNITLQHIKPSYTKKYLKEFVRVLKPNGLLIFQLPNKSNNIKTFVKNTLKNTIPVSIMRLYHKLRYENQPIMEMHCIKKKNVVKLLKHNNAIIIEIKQISDSDENWINLWYFVTK